MEGNSSQPKGCASKSNSGDEDSCFNCNLCLESARDLVVTRCGHLYCWSCIYAWLRIQGNRQTCPVCMSFISLSQLVPLFGCGTSTTNSAARTHNMGVEIPPRPPAASSSMNASAPLPIRRRPVAAITMSDLTMERPITTDQRMYQHSDPSFLYAYSHSSFRYGSGGIPSFGRLQQERVINFLTIMASIFLFCVLILCLIIIF